MVELLAHLHWGALFQIVLIDILLGGDNAVVIALACRRLDRARRIQGILWGTLGAIGLRIVLIAFALSLLGLPWLKLAGALLLVWIGVRLMQPANDQPDVAVQASVWGAIRTIIIADLVMSMDNVIAIAAAAQSALPEHQLAYVAFGLLLSVPIIIWGSTLVLRLLDRFPQLVTLGAGLLGWIAGGMLVSDEVIKPLLHHPDVPYRLMSELVFALLVMLLGWWLARKPPAE